MTFTHGMLSFRTQPPCCEKPQTVSHRETTWRDHVERNWGSSWVPASIATHVNEWAFRWIQPLVSSLSLKAWDATEQRQAIPAVSHPTSWPIESVSMINGCFITEKVEQSNSVWIFIGGIMNCKSDYWPEWLSPDPLPYVMIQCTWSHWS